MLPLRRNTRPATPPSGELIAHPLLIEAYLTSRSKLNAWRRESDAARMREAIMGTHALDAPSLAARIAVASALHISGLPSSPPLNEPCTRLRDLMCEWALDVATCEDGDARARALSEAAQQCAHHDSVDVSTRASAAAHSLRWTLVAAATLATDDSLRAGSNDLWRAPSNMFSDPVDTIVLSHPNPLPRNKAILCHFDAVIAEFTAATTPRRQV